MIKSYCDWFVFHEDDFFVIEYLFYSSKICLSFNITKKGLHMKSNGFHANKS